jgi:hypothetical protein
MVAPSSADLTAWGILPRARAMAIMVQTVHEVILPGLSQFGIKNPIKQEWM